MAAMMSARYITLCDSKKGGLVYSADRRWFCFATGSRHHIN
ncbi:hypothetical protein DDI_2230 [Dickeya dianthicola RNS04.9]|nr:hypothetical protein DDI_2230 [Dickeya dianthicola RNS04.9]